MLETAIAGSLPKPAWLAEPEKLWAPWRLAGADLEQGKRDAALVWLKEQEDAGIDIVGDGEQFRTHFVHGFLERIAGIDWNLKTPMGIRNNRYTVEVPTVTEPVRRTGPVHGPEAAFVRGHTKHAVKWTLPGPMTICDTIADGHYGRRADMAMAFAAVLNEEARELEAAGVDVIQFDEPAFNVFMDEVAEWGVAALHAATEGLTCKTAVHICYGYGIEANIKWKQTLGGEWRQYEAIFRNWTPAVALQIEYSLRQRTVEGDLIPMAQEMGLGVTPWSPLAGGVLTGKYTRDKKPDEGRANSGWINLDDRDYKIIDVLLEVAEEAGASPAEVALKWVQDRDGVTSTIIGARTLEQLDANLNALDVTLTDEQTRKLDEVSEQTKPFPHEFVNNIKTVIQGGTTINGESRDTWENAPQSDKERY